MAKKLKNKIKTPLGLKYELIPFAGAYRHFAEALGDGGDTKWGADSGQTEVPIPKVKKARIKKG